MKKFIFALAICSAILFTVTSCKKDSNPLTPKNDEIPGLVAYFSFDGTVADAANILNASNHNCAFDTNRYGQVNRSCSFNGIDSYVEIPHNAIFDSIESKSALTIAAWINIRAWYQNWNIFNIVCQYESTGDNGWEFGFGSKPYIAMGFTSSEGVGTSVRIDTFQLHRWYHAAVTYDMTQGKVSFYLNGIVLSEQTSSAALLDTQGEPMYIGYSPFGPDEFSDGLIDELYIFNRALTANEINNLYARTK
jgi:hypothetical protein